MPKTSFPSCRIFMRDCPKGNDAWAHHCTLQCHALGECAPSSEGVSRWVWGGWGDAKGLGSLQVRMCLNGSTFKKKGSKELLVSTLGMFWLTPSQAVPSSSWIWCICLRRPFTSAAATTRRASPSQCGELFNGVGP